MWTVCVMLSFLYQWLILMVTIKCSYSVLELEDKMDLDPKIPFDVISKVLEDISEDFLCMTIITGEENERLLHDLHKEFHLSLVISKNVIQSQCSLIFLLVTKKEEIVLLSQSSKWTNIAVILLILDPNCPKIDLMRFSRMIIICSMSKSVYTVNSVGELEAQSEIVNFFNIRSSVLPNHMGKFLRVITFNCPTFSYGTEGGLDSFSNNTDKLDGIEMKMFLEISKRLNFTWKLQEPTELNKWGQRWDNGSWSGGIVGALVDGRADVGFCCLWLAGPQAEDIDLTHPWNILCNTFIAPRPHRLDKLGAVFFPFTTGLWMVLTLITFFMSVLCWCLQWCRLKPEIQRKGHSLGRHVLDAVGILTLANVTPSSPDQVKNRQLVTCWAIFALLMTTAYSSGLVSHLTVPLFDSPLDSVHDLVRANIHWRESYYPAMDVLFDSEDVWHRRFISKFHLDSEAAQAYHFLKSKNEASLGHVLEGKSPYFVQGIPVHPSELSSLRVVRNCVSRYYISLGLARTSPYTESFNEVLVRLVESGIVEQWKESTASKRADPKIVSLFEDDGGKPIAIQSLKLVNLQGAFLLWFSGIFLGTIGFGIEKCFKNIRIKVSKRN